MRQLYLCYPKIQTLSGKLGWSVYCELLSISAPLARSFYEQQSLVENWSVRELKRQIHSGLFERLALCTDKKGVLALSKAGHQPVTAAELVKDPYIFEFLNLPERRQYSEKQLENQLIDKLAQFLLELGKGFAFNAQQFRVTLNNFLTSLYHTCRVEPDFSSSLTTTTLNGGRFEACFRQRTSVGLPTSLP